MEIAEGKQNALELVLPSAHLQGILQHRQEGRGKFTVSPKYTGFQTDVS